MASRLMRCLAAIACTGLLSAAGPRCSTAQSRPVALDKASSAGVAQAMLPVPLTLQAAIELALKTHPDLRVAMADLLVARADSSFARVPAFNPELEVQATRGGGTIGSNTDGTLDLSLSQELEIWGKRGARQTAATARSRSLAAEWRAKLQEIESDVRTRFERALFLQERLQTVNDVTELDRRVVQATQARVRDGSMTPVTARLTELDWLRLEAQGRRTHSNLRKALVDLGLAVGMELPDSTQLSGEVQADSLEAPEDSVVVLALRIRATGEVLRGRIAERRAELQLAEREARPNLTLGVGLARDRASFDGAGFSGDPAIVRGITGARDTDNLWTARLSAPLPLWQTNQAGRARAAAEIMRSEADYDRYRVRTRLEVLGAVRQLQDAAGLYRLYLERSQRVRQDLALIREAYADGRISLDSYLTQKGRLVDTLLGQLEAGDAYWDARGQLEAVVGLDLAHVNAGAR